MLVGKVGACRQVIFHICKEARLHEIYTAGVQRDGRKVVQRQKPLHLIGIIKRREGKKEGVRCEVSVRW